MNRFFSKGAFCYVLIALLSVAFCACSHDEEMTPAEQSTSLVSHSEVKAFAKSLETNMQLYQDKQIDLTTFDNNLLKDLGVDKAEGQSSLPNRVAASTAFDTINTASEVEEYCAQHFSKPFCVMIDCIIYKHELPLDIQDIVDSNDFTEEEKYRLLIAKYYLFVIDAKYSPNAGDSKFCLPPANNGPTQERKDECQAMYNKMLSDCNDQLSVNVAKGAVGVGLVAIGTILTGTGGIILGASAVAEVVNVGIDYEACNAKAKQAFNECLSKPKK